MCNAWNHSFNCTCGWGGEGHLGRNTSGNGGNGGFRSFFSTSRSRKIGSYDPFVARNAKCPVCGEAVYFYQSEFGGRVFFDAVGWPWPKHPCTDNSLHRESTDSIEFVGDDDDREIIRLIAELNDRDYFPLVCSQTKGLRELGAEFLYPENSNSKKKYASVWLRLNTRLRIPVGSIFFIKEVSAKEGVYRLRFYYGETGYEKISYEDVDAEIGAFIRPVLNGGRIEFKDFTGHIKMSPRGKNNEVRIKIKKKSSDAKSGRNYDSTHSSKEILEPRLRCKFCKKSIPDSEFENHRLACGNEHLDCPKCGKNMKRHNLSIHINNHCPQRGL